MAKSASAIPTSAPITVLHGPERFLHLEHSRVLRDALRKAYGEVDVISFNGESVRPAEVLDECRSMGLMVTHKLVIVDEADSLLKSGEGDEDAAPAPARGFASKSPRELFEAYCDSPERATTLLLRAVKWNKGKFDQAVERAGGVLIKCEELSDGDAIRWAIDRAKGTHGVTLNPDAAARLVQALGPEMARLDSELGKLAVTVAARSGGAPGTITAAIVTEMVGESREDEVWSLQQSLLSGDPARAMEDLHRALDISRHNPVLVNIAYLDLCKKLDGLCRGAPVKIWPLPALDMFKNAAHSLGVATTARMFQQAVDADVKLKTGRADPVRLMECMTLQIASRFRR